MLYFFDIVLSHRVELLVIKRDILYQHPVHIVKGVGGCIVKLYQSYTRDRRYIHDRSRYCESGMKKLIK